ncbi:actin-related protein 2/3 complex subunit 1A-like [Elysia marginata]|uniref:Actin-related protein 2/3 complex subunit 1A-like n=1 Tax=Elysia marginata TaxID=1093978 RepID=A0AAV4H5G8_9GAST|nr:actin-related protein 2/3 complex subunit 1A-like [Elysia marginata]
MGNQLAVVKESFLPFMSITWVTENSMVAAGRDCNPMVFSYGEGKITVGAKLDQPQKKQSGNIGAMNRFKNLDKKGTDSNTATDIKTQHQNTNQVSVHTGTKNDASKVATSGLDGNLILWDLKSQEFSIQALRIA